MIYLRPIGGICNRVRAFDSALQLAEIKHQKLTVIWVQNPDLNASFESIFKEIKSPVLHQVINVVPGTTLKQKVISKVLNRIETPTKNIGFNAWINKLALKIILKDFGIKKVFNNNDFVQLIHEIDDRDKMTGIAYETAFLNKIDSITSQIDASGSYFIETCYRLLPLTGQEYYKDFIPASALQEQINTYEIGSDTIGVHIRRTDHHYAKESSPNEVFEKVIREHLTLNDAANVLLCSDDQSVKDYFKTVFGDKIMTIKVNSFDRNDPKAINDAIIELYLLSKTKKIFGSHFSSFSQIAADIGGIPLETLKK